MAYRMKRNGAGLASICVLATMVLVMLSSTTCMYYGVEDALHQRYPRDIGVECYFGDRLDQMDEAHLDILRAAVANGTPVGLKAKEYMDAGKLVPDDVIIGIVCERLAEPDCANGYILDGMPRTIPQAEALEQHGIDVDTALSIEIADETIIERMSGRRTCKDCSATFHIVSNPPKVEGKCDFCGGELTIRKDDAPETSKALLDVYHAETEPLKDFYAQRGKLVKVDNQPTIEATTAAIEKALGLE